VVGVVEVVVLVLVVVVVVVVGRTNKHQQKMPYISLWNEWEDPES